MLLLDKYVGFLIDHDLTQRQFLLLYMLYEDRTDLLTAYKNKFPTETGKMLPDYLIQDLIRKGFIEPTKKSYKLGDKFLRIFVDANRATDEIYELYPPFINNKGVDIPLTSMDKRVFSKIYINKIKGNYEEHKEVLQDIQYGIDNNLITTGIEKFLTSEQWKPLRKLREHTNPPSPNAPINTLDNTYNEFE